MTENMETRLGRVFFVAFLVVDKEAVSTTNNLLFQKKRDQSSCRDSPDGLFALAHHRGNNYNWDDPLFFPCWQKMQSKICVCGKCCQVKHWWRNAKSSLSVWYALHGRSISAEDDNKTITRY